MTHNVTQRPILIRRVWSVKLMIYGLIGPFLTNQGQSYFRIKEDGERWPVINLFVLSIYTLRCKNVFGPVSSIFILNVIKIVRISE
jgi:hypothetical protein